MGPMAKKVISRTTDGVLLGVSSKGIYLRVGEKQVVFLSSEDFRGPLTVNVSVLKQSLQTVSPGKGCQISSGKIVIPGAGIEILADNCPIWQTPIRPQPKSQIERRSILKSFISGIPNWLETQYRWGFSIQKASKLLGKGEGLTPFGDDIIIGVLLCLNRWGDSLKPGKDVKEFNKHIVQAAYRKTTTLSANLVECSSQGQADERLIRAIDYLMSANANPDTIRDDLLEWGYSSGLGVLTGMAMAIEHSDP
jgi:hypothetical protein